jgi:SAM-dependent methyltransferase
MDNMQDHFALFQMGQYHRRFQHNHIHTIRSTHLRSSYRKSLEQLHSLGWPDPLMREEPRILLCGTASAHTTITFARFINAYQQKAQLDVLDISAYPLQQSQRLLQHCRDLDQMHISFVESNALQMPFSDGCFDWIETDFFLQFFSSMEKEALFREWYRLLKPGGIITTRDWLQQKGNFVEQGTLRMKSWLVRHTLGPITYSASLVDVREMSCATGFEVAFFSEKIFRIRLPLLTSILLYKLL